MNQSIVRDPAALQRFVATQGQHNVVAPMNPQAALAHKMAVPQQAPGPQMPQQGAQNPNWMKLAQLGALMNGKTL